jgi:hypothetical protein
MGLFNRRAITSSGRLPGSKLGTTPGDLIFKQNSKKNILQLLFIPPIKWQFSDPIRIIPLYTFRFSPERSNYENNTFSIFKSTQKFKTFEPGQLSKDSPSMFDRSMARNSLAPSDRRSNMTCLGFFGQN